LFEQASAPKPSEAQQRAVHLRVAAGFSLSQSARNHELFYAKLLRRHS